MFAWRASPRMSLPISCGCELPVDVYCWCRVTQTTQGQCKQTCFGHSRHAAALACEVFVDVIVPHVEQLAVFAGDAVTHCLQSDLLALVQHRSALLRTMPVDFRNIGASALTYLCACGCSLICQEAALQSRSIPSMA